MLEKLSHTLFLCLCFSISSYSQAKVKAAYNYLLYLPEGYTKNQKQYPLVIYLHGGSQRGNDLTKLKVYGLPYLVGKGQNFDFIIASPQCPDNKYWSTENWLDSLYSELISKYRVNSKKVYLTGISMGGYGTYIVAMDFPERFAAIVPLCGGMNDSDTSRVCNLSRVPIWTFHGTIDDKVSIGETERIVNGLKSCKGDVRFSRLTDKGHDIEYLYETKPEIYKWLLKHEKQ
jgi:predicted peptidase